MYLIFAELFLFFFFHIVVLVLIVFVIFFICFSHTTCIGGSYSCENGKLGTHRNKMFLSAVCGMGGSTVIGTSEGDLLLFQGILLFRNIYV